MSMTTEDAIYNVDMCGCTGVACIRCNHGPCENRKVEKRHHPWQGFVDVDAKDACKVPEEDLSGIEGGADARGHQHDVLSGISSVGGRFL